jgi:hypothetical protein
MAMPRFTAEASLYRTGEGYPAAVKADSAVGVVNPALGNCLKKLCYLRVVKQWPRIVVRECRWVVANC